MRTHRLRQVGGDINSVASPWQEIEDVPIRWALFMSERSFNCLARVGIRTIGQLLKRSSRDLLSISNFGRLSLQELETELGRYGLKLSDSDDADWVHDMKSRNLDLSYSWPWREWTRKHEKKEEAL